MARTRTIKPEFWDDEKLANVSRDARLIFIGLWKCSDDYGVTKGNSKWLKSQIFPYDDDIKNGQFEGWLGELEKIDCIVAFNSHNESYYFIKSFNDYQKIEFIIKLGEEITRRGIMLSEHFDKTSGNWSEIEKDYNRFVELET